MPRELAPTRECVSVASADGRLFNDYWDPVRLESHLKELSPADAGMIEEYTHAITRFAKSDLLGEAMVGSRLKAAGMLPGMVPLVKWFKPTMEQYAQKLSDPFLSSAFPLLEYSLKDAPFAVHLMKHAYGYNKNIAWPVGGAKAFAQSIEKRYTDLSGEVHYRQRVEKILTENGAATGVRLEDGSVHKAGRVICDADGRKAIQGMLDGKYMDDKIKAYCEEPEDETNWAVHVFLGVARDLSGEPSALVQLLDRPVELAGQKHSSLEMQTYGMDPTIAPEGKGVIKVEMFSSYAYWKALHANRELYDEEKEKVSASVIDILDRTRFPGITGQVEAVDVPTLMTWESYVGGTHGFLSSPKKKFNPLDMMRGRLDSTLPGLSDFYLVGTWATSAGALFANALSGRTIVRELCKRDGKTFTAG